jgi:hypothetical protein
MLLFIQGEADREKIKRKGPPGLRPKKKKQRETHKPLQSE